ncbi:hypothetical protein RFI_32543, partial [Reticulomyxa filosa]
KLTQFSNDINILSLQKKEENINDKISKLLTLIIIDKKEYTKNNWCEIPLLPDIPQLKQIKIIIENNDNKKNLHTRLIDILILINNDSSPVRKTSLETLLYFIRKERKQFELIILKDIKYEQLLRRLINSLLKLSIDKDKDIIHLCSIKKRRKRRRI